MNRKNSYHAQIQDLKALSVFNVGFQKCDSLFTWGPGVRNHFLIHYIISGKGTYIMRNNTFELETGDCFLIYPDEECMYQADDINPWEYSWVGFSGDDAIPITEASGFSKEHPFLKSISNGGSFNQQIHRIYDARGNTFANSLEMSGRLYTALSFLLKGSYSKTSENTVESYVKNAVDYIQLHYSYPLTIQEVADYVGVSRSHLFRIFKDYTGQSPKDYLNSLRIEEACRMLKTTNLSVSVIANSLGFDNNLYFSKFFKKMTGYSPTEYSKKYINEQN